MQVDKGTSTSALHAMPGKGERLNILLAAYACAPNQGSEPGVGWNYAVHLAKRHNVWAMTRTSNRAAIEQELAQRPIPGLKVLYHEVKYWPEKGTVWHSANASVELRYYLWQLTAHRMARRTHQRVGFALAQHLTYVRYWMPSTLAFLPVPFLWGPVGGGESVPPTFFNDLERKDGAMEWLRGVVHWIGEQDPLVRLTARRCQLALATTPETAARLTALNVPAVQLQGESALHEAELVRLGQLPAADSQPFRFISMGRLIHWKGFHYGLQAFARAQIPEAEYWVVGDGPELGRLQQLASDLDIADRVRFWGWLPREEALQQLGACHALVHPSLHDSGGWICLEAMAARRPVLCLDLGGPAYQVSDEAGFKIPAHTPSQAIDTLATKMRLLTMDRVLQRRMGAAGHRRVQEHFTWTAKIRTLCHIYDTLLGVPSNDQIPAEPLT